MTHSRIQTLASRGFTWLSFGIPAFVQVSEFFPYAAPCAMRHVPARDARDYTLEADAFGDASMTTTFRASGWSSPNFFITSSALVISDLV